MTGQNRREAGDKFRPAWWLPGPHLQTLWPVLIRRRIKLQTRRERFELPDDDFLDLDWVQPDKGKFSNARSDALPPIVLVLHGLEGSIDSSYARGLLRQIAHLGWRGVLMHFRGCSGEANRLRRGYHSGETGDLRWLISELRRREPKTPIAAVGYSIGGNVLLKYLGECGRAASPDEPQPQASSCAGIDTAVAVSVPLVLSRCADRMERGFSKLYQKHLINCLHRTVLRKAGHIAATSSAQTESGEGALPERSQPDSRAASNNLAKATLPKATQTINDDLSSLGLDLSLAKLKSLRTFRSFDDQVTAPLHGFRDSAHYYEDSSSRQFLKHIRVPTLLIQASDDPFMSPDVLPGEDELSPSVTLEVHAHGGHVGFVTGPPWRPRYWLEQRIPEHLASMLEKSRG